MEEKYYLQDVLDDKLPNPVVINCGTPDVTTALAHLLNAYIRPKNPYFYNEDDDSEFLILTQNSLKKRMIFHPNCLQTTSDKFIVYTTEGKEVTLQDMLDAPDIKERILQDTKRRSSHLKKQIVDEITMYEKDIQGFLNLIEKRKSQIKALQEQLAEVNEELPCSLDLVCSEIEDIKNNENCEGVTILNEYIYARTKDLYITEPTTSRKFYLGKMLFKIPLDTSKHIYMWNLTKQRDAYSKSMQHPHIFSDGAACFGNTDTMLSQFLSDQQYNAVFCTLLSFCQTANIEDEAGEKLAEWPEVAADGTLFQGEEFKSCKDYECPCCGETYCEDDGCYCEDCGNTVCEDCAVYISSEDKYVCQDCFDKHYARCDECGENFHRNDLEYIDGHHVCQDCLQDCIENGDVVECAVCGELHFTTRMIEYRNEHDEVIYCCPECEKPEGYTLA